MTVDPRVQARRDKRLAGRAHDFLHWLQAIGSSADQAGAAASVLRDVIDMPMLRHYSADVAAALHEHPACCGQLPAAAPTAQPDARGSYIPPITLAPELCDASMTGWPAPAQHTTTNSNFKSSDANLRVFRSVADWDGGRYGRSAAQRQAMAQTWCTHEASLLSHYADQRLRKRNKVDTSTYAGPVMESVIAAALDASPLHRWYAATAPRANSRHMTYNFLQEVAIAEHARALQQVIASRGEHVDAVVDFGGGNGILAYVAALRLGGIDGVVVDKFTPGFTAEGMLAAMSASDTASGTSTAAPRNAAGPRPPLTIPGTCCRGAFVDPAVIGTAPRVRLARVATRIESLDWERDIVHRPGRTVAISKHLCGNGVDLVLRRCEASNAWPAAFALSSCCHHKLVFADYVNQSFLRQLGITSPDVLSAVGRKAGWLASENPLWQQRVGGAVEALLDHGRVLWLRQRGYAAFSVTCMSTFLSPRNRMLVAWRRDGLLDV